MKKFHLPTDRPIVTYVGRIDPEKHLRVLLKAFSHIQKQTDAHLLVVGHGTDVDDLKRQAHDLSLTSHITFTGKVTDEELVALHRVGTVFCMPSPAELQSIASLEAMASGQPVVAVDAGALRELCQDGVNGYLCRQDDDEQIAMALQKIILDQKLRATFSKASLAIATTHDIQHTLDEFEAIYSKLIATSRALVERL